LQKSASGYEQELSMLFPKTPLLFIDRHLNGMPKSRNQRIFFQKMLFGMPAALSFV
jgi:hypothetical protein